MPEVIYVRALCKAATVLGLTNQEVADRLGVKPEIFDDAVTREENGGHLSVSSKHPNIYAAATALLEEASQIENGGQDDVFAVVGDGGAPRRPESETRETPGKGCAVRSGHAGTDASADGADHAGDPDNDYSDSLPDELIEKAVALSGTDKEKERHARAIIAAAGRADMDAIEDSQLIDALSKSLKVGKRAITKLLKEERNAYRAGQDNFDRKQQTVADTLLYLVEQAGWKTWKDRRTDEAVVTIAPGQHLPARSRLMRQALIRLWRNQRPDGRRVCPTEAVDAVIATLAAEVAALQPTTASVVRYAAAGDDRMAPDGVVVDFGDETFEALFITPTGMTVIGPETIDAAGIRFIRPMLMSKLPRPKRDATPQEAIDRLAQLISLDPTTDVKLVFGVLVASLLPLPAVLPVIVLAAPQGSGKTAVANGLKSVLDPAAVGASAMPRTRDDLVVRLSKARCLALDNVSSLDDDTSDLLCIASTGGSSTRRTLYTDDDEIALQLHASPILTAIDESIFGRSDLLSRAVILGLMKPPGGQQSERQTEALWTAALPVVLGGLYSALSRVLDKIDWSGKSAHGRMAASVQVLEALDAAGVCGGGFVSVYATSRQAAAGDFVLRDEMLREIIRTVLGQPMSPIDGSYSWAGSGSALYAALGGNRHNAGKDWPRSDAALTRRLKDLAPVLDQVGVVVEFRRTKKARSTEITIDEITADALRAAAARAGSPFPEDLDEAEK